MKVIFNADIKANLTIDENENVRDIIHSQEYWKSNKQKPLDVAIDYLQNVSHILKISKESLRNIYQNVSFDDPKEQDVEYRLSAQKQIMDSTTVGFSQTVVNVPIWQTGLTITIKDNPYRVIHVVNTSQKDVDVKLPPSDAIKHHKQLFHIKSGKERSNKRKRSFNREEKSKASTFIRALINKKELSKSNEKIKDNARPIRGRFFVYKYDEEDRLPAVENEHTTEIASRDNELRAFKRTLLLPIYPVNVKIKHGHYYVVDEITFSFTTVEYGAINWIALVELETRSVLYIRALAADTSGQVFKHDPITISSNLSYTPNQGNGVLNPFRLPEVLNELNLPVGGIQSLSGTRVNITNVEGPNIAPPTNPGGVDYNYDVRTDNFSAVNAYLHNNRFFSFVESLGFPIATYFSNTTFPIPIDHRGAVNTTNGIEVNAHCIGDGAGGIAHCCYCLAETSNTINPIGIANDWRVVLHELAGHGILYEYLNSPNFMFSHSAGDSFAVILSDPESQIFGSDRFLNFPWVNIGRRCDRDVSTWAWGGPNDQPFTPTDPFGYLAEEILATTHFRIYRSIGGDSTDINRKRFAARMTAYLILRAVSTLNGVTNNPNNALAFANVLMAVDLLNWTTEGVSGGAYNKVIRWSFEKQGLYQPSGAPIPVTTEGDPPPVDVYIDDGRHGEYQYQPIHWDNSSIWNRRMADGLVGHQDPLIGSTNYIYLKIKNRGTQTANNVKVRGYHSRSGAGLLIPNDIQSLTTAELPVGTLAGNNSEEKTVGPFEWIPEINAYGHDCIIMIASAGVDDPSNFDNFTSGETIPEWRLVPNDNNIGQKNMLPVPGISQIKLTVRTGDEDIDDDDKVYLGFGGREFRCRFNNDSDANPFHIKNNTVTLIFGLGSNVEDSATNDPRNPLMDLSDPSEFPVYIRVQPKSDSWEIKYATVETVPQTSIFSIKHPGITLGDDSGEIVDLV